MGKIGALILSFTILFQSFNFEVDDMYKLPTFINHISSHIDSGDNFAEFIDLHYGNKVNSHKNKHQEHKKLPFKHQQTDANLQLIFILNSLNFDLNITEIVFKNKNFNYKEPSYNQYIYSIFQPPQK